MPKSANAVTVPPPGNAVSLVVPPPGSSVPHSAVLVSSVLEPSSKEHAVHPDKSMSASISGELSATGSATRGSRDKEGLVGQTVNDKYRVTGVIAKGGMGVVYRAEQLPLGRPVALKLIHTDLDEENPESDFQRRFFLEAASCAKLTHPNIVVIYDYGQLELTSGRSSAYMAMELLEGRTLGEALKRDPRFNFGRALRIAREIARALREAHRQEMVHRDLKPTNVMVNLTSDGESVKVLDFGLVKLMHDDSAEMTREGLFMGSPKYMAPEQINREPIDGRSDLYALGVLLYQMLVGRVPFEGDNQIQTLMSHLHDTVPALPSEVPDEVQQIVMRCLEKSREARFDSADALIAAIDAAITTLGTGTSGVLSGEMTIPPREKDTTVSRKVGTSRTSVTTQVSTTQSATPARAVDANHFDVDVSEPPAKSTRSPLLRAVLVGAVAVLATGGLVWLLGEDVQTAADPTPVVAPQPLIPAVQEPTAPTAFTVFIDSAPSGAEVFRGEERVGATPTFVTLGPADLAGGGVPFRVALEGYGSYVWTQGPVSEDVHVLAPLVALAPPPETPLDRVVPRRDRTPRVRLESRPEQRQPEDVVIKTRR